MIQRRTFEREGVKLSVLDFGGAGSPVLLLHGLAGHAGEWAETSSWLTERHRVWALDGRGHGRSERLPHDVSPEAQIADVAFILERMAPGPVVLVGQSLGGLIALMLAARHPALVSGLVVAEAAPSEGGQGREAGQAIGDALRSWPVPFRSKQAGQEFFRARFGDGAAGAWADGLEASDDGWRPRFDVEVMVQTLSAAQEPSTWADWEAITCPVLLIRAGRGIVGPRAAREMKSRLPAAEVIELAEAGHDLHLDRPAEWRDALSAFLDRQAADQGRT